jgi:hypothetical protein
MKTALAFWKGSTVPEASPSTQLRRLFMRSCLISAAVLCLSPFQHEAQAQTVISQCTNPVCTSGKACALYRCADVTLDMPLAMTRILQAETSQMYSSNPRITGQSTTPATCGTTGLRQQVRSKSRQSLCPRVAYKRADRLFSKIQSPSMRARSPWGRLPTKVLKHSITHGHKCFTTTVIGRSSTSSIPMATSISTNTRGFPWAPILLPESMHQTAICSKETELSSFSSRPMCLPRLAVAHPSGTWIHTPLKHHNPSTRR